MITNLISLICLFGLFLQTLCFAHTDYQIVMYSQASKYEAQAAFQYFYDQVEQDPFLTHEEQYNRIQEFKNFSDTLSQEVSIHLISLLQQETRRRIIDILQNAGLDSIEIATYLDDYERAILKVKEMNVEIARQMLFFVAELKIHRQYVREFGLALGCPEEQLLHHDLCKLSSNQFEGYARYFRGGRRDDDKPAYLAAWAIHQYEEHHLESYSKPSCDFTKFTPERLQNNMLESVADLLASTKQRGGGTLIHYLVNVFPKKNPDPRLIPYLECGLKKAHALYLDSKEDPDSIFTDLPSWNSDVEAVFNDLKLRF